MLKVLITDDSRIMRKTVRKYFEDMGHQIVGEAENGKKSIEEYEKLKPDLVTMDITMPIMHGIDAVKGIMQINKEAKIIMITSHGEEQLVMDAVMSGAKGYIIKPLSEDKLIRTLKKVFP